MKVNCSSTKKYVRLQACVPHQLYKGSAIANLIAIIMTVTSSKRKAVRPYLLTRNGRSGAQEEDGGTCRENLHGVRVEC